MPTCRHKACRLEEIPETPSARLKQQQTQREQQVELHLNCQHPGNVVAAPVDELIVLEQEICECLPASADLCVKRGARIKCRPPENKTLQLDFLRRC